MKAKSGFLHPNHATLLPLISSAVQYHLDVGAYLKDTLDQLLTGSTDYVSVRADVWKQSHSEHVLVSRREEGGFCQSSGPGGDFVSVRRRFEWKKGSYTYRVVKMDRELMEGKPATWTGAFVHSHEKDEKIFIGALRFKGENLVLDRKVASFVEVYGNRIPVD